MKTSALIVLAAAAGLANAHATVFNIFVNDKDQGRGDGSAAAGNQYIRSPPNNSPVVDVKSIDIRCNTKPGAVTKTVSVAPGDKVGFRERRTS